MAIDAVDNRAMASPREWYPLDCISECLYDLRADIRVTVTATISKATSVCEMERSTRLDVFSNSPHVVLPITSRRHSGVVVKTLSLRIDGYTTRGKDPG
jgi:hypothetical protein